MTTADVIRAWEAAGAQWERASLTAEPSLVFGNDPESKRQCKKTIRRYCPHGHRMAGDNLYVYTDKKGHKTRRCKECNRLNNGWTRRQHA